MKRNLKRILTYTSIYLAIGVTVMLLMCRSCFSSWQNSLINIGFGTLACIVLWEGNGYLSDWIDRYVTWVEAPVKRFILGLIGMVVYSTLAFMVIFTSYAGGLMSLDYAVYRDNLWESTLFALVFTAFISLILHSRSFLLNWREEALRAEKLRNEQIQSRFLSLRNQLKPHFLFNSLNALSSLVYQDADQAARFIKYLSNLYRYILEYADQEVVSLSKELECAKAYVFLQQIRFGDNFQVEIEVDESHQWMIPPLTLQLLIENAIKHNEISQAQPLLLRIWTKGEQLFVENKLQARSDVHDSTGVGLTNIRARYQHLSQQTVDVEQDEQHYRVRLPLLSFRPTA